jgi:hypothetical protein
MDSKTNRAILYEVRDQLARTLAMVEAALDDTFNERYSEFHSRTFAAAKRSALDLKMELTKLTQSSKYKWNK